MPRTCANQVRGTVMVRAPAHHAKLARRGDIDFRIVGLMSSLLQRLYKTKLALIATVFTTSGIAFLAVARWQVWGSIPVGDVGSALLTTGLLALAFEYFDSQDADERLKAVIDTKAPVLRDSVVEGFVTRPERLTSIASPETLNTVIRNCITAQLSDPELAADLYTNLAWQISEATKPPQYDAHVTLSLAPSEHGPRTGFGSMFVVTTRWQYRTPNLPPLLRFSAVTDPQVYQQLTADPASIETWLLHPSKDDFELLQCTINGQPQTIARRKNGNNRLFTVTTNSVETSGYIDVTYTHRTLVSQHGHQLFIDFSTTKGLRLDFTYTPECDIRHVNVLPYIASPTQPRVERSPHGITNPSISLDFGDAWTFPRSGVVFTWLLNREVAPPTAS